MRSSNHPYDYSRFSENYDYNVGCLPSRCTIHFWDRNYSPLALKELKKALRELGEISPSGLMSLLKKISDQDPK